MSEIPKESMIESYFKDQIEKMGGKCLKFVSPGTKAVSDRLVVLPNNVHAFVELKRLGEELEPLQAKFLRDMRKLGHYADWADRREGVDRILGNLKQRMERANYV
jgi:hypothetical protein